MTERIPERPRARLGPFWLIARREHSRLEVLVSEFSDGRRTLSVFSFEEEAELYLLLGAFGEGWRVWVTDTGELASILLGPCRDVERVALDPLPGTGAEPVNQLVSLSRGSFLNFLLGDDRRGVDEVPSH